MSTEIRPEMSKKNHYHISKERYYELVHFCRQYPEWKEQLKALDGFRNIRSGIQPRQPVSSDLTAKFAIARESYTRKMDMIRRALDRAENDPTMKEWLFRGVTVGLTFDKLQAQNGVCPVSRDAYYASYRRFFWCLDKERDM